MEARSSPELMSGFRSSKPQNPANRNKLDSPIRNPETELSSTVSIDQSFPERVVNIGNNLPREIRNDLISFLKKNIRTFAWSAEDMPGINIDVASHNLYVDPTFKPVKQKRRKLGPERAKAVNDEVDKLLKIGSIREVQYPDWRLTPLS